MGEQTQEVGTVRQSAMNRIGVTLNEVDTLSIAEIKFIGELVERGLNHPGEAYKAVGFKVNSDQEARARAKELMTKTQVRRVLEKYINNVLDPYRQRIEFILIEMFENRALWKITDFFNSDGSVKPLDEIPDTSLYAIDGIKTDYKGRDAQRKVITYELANRKEAFEMMTKYLKKGETKAPQFANEQKKRVMEIMAKVTETVEKEAHNKKKRIKHNPKGEDEDAS